MKFILTGASGYRGSNLIYKLSKHGTVLAIDVNPLKSNLEDIRNVSFFQMDLAKEKNLSNLFEILNDNSDSIILHLAALKSVKESVENPNKYLANNLEATRNLIQAMTRVGMKHLIFASSAAVYGNISNVVSEDAICSPINPYGSIKLLEEDLILKFAQETSINICLFRFFNVVGSLQPQLIDLSSENLFSAINKAAREKSKFMIFGNDYLTRDGTCVRDYIHISDLCDAFMMASEIISDSSLGIINLGSGEGYSVLEIVKAFEKYLNFEYSINQRRAGDPSNIVADIRKAKDALGWYPKRSLSEMVTSSIQNT